MNLIEKNNTSALLSLFFPDVAVRMILSTLVLIFILFVQGNISF